MTPAVLGLLVFAVAGAAASATLAVLVPVLRRHVLDNPSARSSHSTPTPRGGGVGVVVGVVIGTLLAALGGVPTSGLAALVIAVVGLGALGFLEDVRGLPVRIRLLGQAGVPLLVVAVGVLRHEVDPLLAAVAVLVGVFVVNAANFMDGVNGISGGHGILAGGYFSVLGLQLGRVDLALAGLAVAGAFAGFLPWNVPRARVFLGDVGSYALGAALWALGLWALVLGASPLVVVAPVAIYAVDVLATLVSRGRRGAPLTEAHHEHTYQRVQELTGRHSASALTAIAASLACCAGGVLARASGSAWAVPLVVDTLASLAYLASPTLVRRITRA
jgi:UDP-GlcNAc:undecaprenyl-phosphate/decaprenyl-phosphate GlcNAc-1-phosphate transferase